MTAKEELELMSYQPEMWLMRKDAIYSARFALKIGIKYIQEAIDHTLSNEVIINTHVKEKLVEIMKNEKLICEQALEGLVKPE
jgi:hypothetical protein